MNGSDNNERWAQHALIINAQYDKTVRLWNIYSGNVFKWHLFAFCLYIGFAWMGT